MTRRTRLQRNHSRPKKQRLKAVELNKRHLYLLKFNGKSNVGYYGVTKEEDVRMFSGKPPYIRIFLPAKDAKWVRIDWKKGILYDLFTGKPFGKLPEKIKWETYVPVKVFKKGHPRTLLEEEIGEIKKQAKLAKEKRELSKAYKELEIEQIKTKGILERIKEGTFP